MGIVSSLLDRRAAAKEQTANTVCCMGDSLTYGHGLLQRDSQSYPAQLQQLLLSGCRQNKTRFRVINCGASGACATRTGDFPYWNTSEYKTGVAAQPSFIVLLLGTNDCKPNNWEQGTFAQDLQDAIAQLRKAFPHCRMLLCRPPPIFLGDLYVTEHEAMRKAVDEVAAAGMADGTVSAVVDVYAALNDEGLFPDFVHPGIEGAQEIAQAIYAAILDTLRTK